MGHILAPALLLSYILRVYFFRRTCNISLAQSLSKSMLPTTSPEVFRLPSSFFKFSLHILPPCSSFTGPHRPTLPYSISDHKYEAPLIFRHAHLRHSYLHSQRDINRAPGLFPTQPLLLSHFAYADTCCNCPLVFSCAAFEPPLCRLCAYLPPRRHLPRAAPAGPPAPTSTPLPSPHPLISTAPVPTLWFAPQAPLRT